MTIKSRRPGLCHSAFGGALALLALACNNAPSLSLRDAEDLARPAIVGFSNVQFLSPSLILVNAGPTRYQLRTGITATKNGRSVSIPTAAIDFALTSEGQYIPDARLALLALNERLQWQTMTDHRNTKRDDDTVRGWQMK